MCAVITFAKQVRCSSFSFTS